MGEVAARRADGVGPSNIDSEIVDALRAWRLKTSRERSIAPYMVFWDRTMEEIAATRPDSLEALGRCWGMGANKVRQFGPAILAVIRPFGPSRP